MVDVAKKRRNKMPVSERAIIQRINRKLKPALEALKVARSERMRLDVGQYYIIDYRMNAILHHDVDPEALGRELGVLKPWEEVRYE
jgi:hypothetical protein